MVVPTRPTTCSGKRNVRQGRRTDGNESSNMTLEHRGMKETLEIGARVVATKNVGPVRDGQPGIITEVVEQPFFVWRRRMYLCTFLGNVKVAMTKKEISDYDHGYSTEELERGEAESLGVAAEMQQILPLKK